MAVQHVKIDQIDEDQPLVERVHCAEGLRHAIGVGLGLFLFANAPPQEHVEDLADAIGLNSARL